MISIRDSLVITVAKIRTQKRKTALSVIVAGMLFGFLLGAIIVSRGALQSVTAFSDHVMGGKQLILASKVVDTASLVTDPILIQRAEREFQALVGEKEQYAKQIGYTYDPAQEVPVTITQAGQSTKQLNPANDIAKKVMEEASSAKEDLSELEQYTHDYSINIIRGIEGLSVADGVLSQADSLPGVSASSSLYSQGKVPFIVDDSILESYIMDHSLLNEEIPIVVPYSVVEEKLGLSELPQSATANEKIERVKRIKEGAGNMTFELCYRNDASVQRLEQAMLDEATQAQSTGVVYAEPDNHCGPVEVIKDTRTQNQKLAEEKKQEFSAHFGEETTPQQHLFTYKVIGVTPDNLTGVARNNLSQILLSSLSPPGFGFSAIPAQSLAHLNTEKAFHNAFIVSQSTSSAFSLRQYLIEFNDPEDTVQFMKERECNPNCGNEDFSFSQFGSSSVQLTNMQESLEKIYFYAVGVVSFIAVIILGGTFSRIVVDSRKETAVFRAIGGRKSEIVKIYIVYSTILALLTLLFTLAVGYIVALVAHLLYTRQLFSELQATYGLVDEVPGVSLVVFVPNEILIISVLIVLSAILSMGLSLVGNLRRNISTDLKSE